VAYIDYCNTVLKLGHICLVLEAQYIDDNEKTTKTTGRLLMNHAENGNVLKTNKIEHNDYDTQHSMLRNSSLQW